MTLIRISSFCLIGFFLQSCASDAKAPVPFESSNPISSNAISGNILFSGDPSALQGAEIIVRLQDVSRMDVSSVTLAKQVINNKQQFPIPFTLTYDPTKVQKHGRYSVSARIEKLGNLLFINDTHIPVFSPHSDIDPHNIRLPVIKVN